jgi:16S rRNA processing protein RimM
VSDFVAIGKVSSPVGLKGEVKVVSLTHSPGRFESVGSVWIGNDGAAPVEFLVEAVRCVGLNVVLKLGGVGTRTEAEQLRGKLVLVPSEQMAHPSEGSYLIDDVVGMKVLTEEGKEVGIVRDVLKLPANDLWEVECGSRIISIPAVKQFIRRVDLESKTIVIHEVEGLLEL